ncbi:MAG: regulatory protein RecX [Bacillota bacterium]
MKIENIKFGKKFASIVVDGEQYSKLSLLAVQQYRFTEPKEIHLEDWREFLTYNDETLCKENLMAMLARSMRTEKEARIKLRQKGHSTSSINKAMELAKSYGYLSDTAYAENFVNCAKSSSGKFKIKRTLKERGVADEIIEQYTTNLEEDELHSAKNIATKYMRSKSIDDPKVKEKLFRHLASRGFSYDTIKSVVASIGIQTDDFE